MNLMENIQNANVEIKQKLYHCLMEEAAKAEMIQNGLECGVPVQYIKAMITGSLPESGQGAEGTKTCGAWGLLATSIETILNGWEKEDQVLAISENIRALTEEAINVRLKEVRMRQYEAWAEENEKPVQEREELEKIRIPEKMHGEEDTECLQKKLWTSLSTLKERYRKAGS